MYNLNLISADFNSLLMRHKFTTTCINYNKLYHAHIDSMYMYVQLFHVDNVQINIQSGLIHFIHFSTVKLTPVGETSKLASPWMIRTKPLILLGQQK